MRFSNFKYGLVTIILIFVLGCKKANDKNEPSNEITVKEDVSLNAKQIAGLNYTEYVLSNLAVKETQDWLKLQELNSQIEILKKADLSFFNNDNELLSTFFKELKAEIPQQLKTNAIEARIIVLETSSFKLEGASKLVKMDKKTLLDYVKSVLVSHSNLILQINKKLEKDAQDISLY